MTIKEMQDCATDTRSFFMRSMPDIPFSDDDIIIEFASRTKMVERAKVLCALYVPDKEINETQAEQLAHSIGVNAINAIIGREKSAILVRMNHKNTKQDWRMVMFQPS